MNSAVRAMFQNELILPVSFSIIALFMDKLPIIYIGIGDVMGSNNNRFELLLRGYVGSVAVGNYQSAKSLFVTRQMYGGFFYTTNAYFLALDTITTMYTIRMCNDASACCFASDNVM